MESKREPKTINETFQIILRNLIRRSDFAQVARSTQHLPKNTYKSKTPLEVTYEKKITYSKILYWGDILRRELIFEAQTRPERIEDAMRCDTAAPSDLGLGVSFSVSASGVRRFMLGVRLVDLV